MSFQKNLFQLVSKAPVGAGNMRTGSAPELQHVSQSKPGLIQSHLDKETFINVRDSFPWSNSPQRAIQESPYIDLVELDIQSNPMLNQIATNLAVGGNLIPENLKNMVKSEMTAIVEENAGAEAQMATGGAWDLTKIGTDTVVQGLGDAVQDTPPGDTLFPYDNMYTTKPTGFRYIMPYYTQNWRSLVNAFTNDKGETGSGAAAGILDKGKELSETAANLGKVGGLNFMAPGQYIEQSKFFGFPGREKTYTFSFPLANTRPLAGMSAFETISRNWQFLYLLIYQNSPNRMTRDLILPPCIYEAHVPGIWYSKYSYISALNVDFVGTRRRMKVRVPQYDDNKTLGSLSIPTIIPDVYQVTISMTELVGESQNMLYHMIKGKNVMMSANNSSVDEDGFADMGFDGMDTFDQVAGLIPGVSNDPGVNVRSSDASRSDGRRRR